MHLNLVQSILKQLVITLKISICNVDIAQWVGVCRFIIHMAVCRVAANCIFYESDQQKGGCSPLPRQQVKLCAQPRVGSVVSAPGKAGVESTS